MVTLRTRKILVRRVHPVSRLFAMEETLKRKTSSLSGAGATAATSLTKRRRRLKPSHRLQPKWMKIATRKRVSGSEGRVATTATDAGTNLMKVVIASSSPELAAMVATSTPVIQIAVRTTMLPRRLETKVSSVADVHEVTRSLLHQRKLLVTDASRSLVLTVEGEEMTASRMLTPRSKNLARALANISGAHQEIDLPEVSLHMTWAIPSQVSMPDHLQATTLATVAASTKSSIRSHLASTIVAASNSVAE